MAFNILFCGTPDFAVPSLTALHEDPDFQVHQVLSQPDRPAGRGNKLQSSPVKQWAQAHGLRVQTPSKASAPEFVDEIRNQNYDVGVVVAFGQILSQAFLDSFRFGCVNIHGSLLPRWRGAAPIQRAVMAGDSITGVSLQKVVKKLDAGDVIAERQVQLPLEMGATELYQNLSVLGAELLVTDLKKFLRGEHQAIVQDESQVTHAAKIEKSEGLIDWRNTAREIHNKVRGLDMGGPYAYTICRGKTLKLLQTKPQTFRSKGEDGTILEIHKDSMVIACGFEALEVFTVQPESKSRMSVADFLRGYQLKVGEKFG